MEKPTIILATSNGVGMGHLARASAIALALKEYANPIIVSMAGGIAEIPEFMGIRCEYIPGRDRMWMSREKWDEYLRDRLLALVDETGARVMSFDGVVPYPGVIAAKVSHPKLALVWVRRGLWQKKPQRFVLGLQSQMMDYIVEPGDFARYPRRAPLPTCSSTSRLRCKRLRNWLQRSPRALASPSSHSLCLQYSRNR